MLEQPKLRNTTSVILATLLWLASFALGLESINDLKGIFILIRMRLGANLEEANAASLALVYFLGLAFLIFIIVYTEYHFKHVGKPESWRLFAWTIAVEVSILLLYYLL
jgi:hypothetical protein